MTKGWVREKEMAEIGSSSLWVVIGLILEELLTNLFMISMKIINPIHFYLVCHNYLITHLMHLINTENCIKIRYYSKSAVEYYANCTWFDEAVGDLISYLKGNIFKHSICVCK